MADQHQRGKGRNQQQHTVGVRHHRPGRWRMAGQALHVDGATLAVGVPALAKTQALADRRPIRPQAEALDVDEQLGAAAIGRDEAVTLGVVPLSERAGAGLHRGAR